MQETGERGFLPQRRSIARQNQKGRLKSILGVLLVPQHAPADVKHHWPVAMDEAGESLSVAAALKRQQQLFIAFLVAEL